MQVELHPQLADRKMVGVLFRKGVQCVAACPLAGRDSAVLSHPSVTAVAEELGKSAHEVLLKWNTQRGIPVLPSMHSDLSVDAANFFSWKFTNAQKVSIAALALACCTYVRWCECVVKFASGFDLFLCGCCFRVM